MIRLALLCLLALRTPAAADTALFAVAANFATTAEALAADYKAESGHEITITTGSTGKLYAQIVAGAPFDAMLSADTETPERLAQMGHGQPKDYALGLLSLWMPGAAPDADPETSLRSARHVAIANPELAPYGKAAMAALEGMGLTDTVRDRLVTGENIGQAFAMVKSGAAEAGFVAASALQSDAGGLRWTVTPSLYPPIRQSAILLKHGEANAAAQGFLAFLASDTARSIITGAGYGLPE